MYVPHLEKLAGQHCWFYPNRTLFWEEEKTLVLADTHFGKTGHFRKHGIGLSDQIATADLHTFFHALQLTGAKNVLVVGDMFHSHHNQELERFLQWRQDHANVNIQLVQGNHDQLKKDWYQKADIELVAGLLHKGPFSFVHDPAHAAQAPKGQFIFSGHLHPGFYLGPASKGAGKMPCFYVKHQHCILPAFSRFSGMALVKPKKGETLLLLHDQTI
ncbi:MAG: ligase-associated DNA damage response endonuclease PdeM, partial [Sphingobacteriia bacterium]